MTKAIEDIVTGYTTHRRRLLNEHRMRRSSVLHFESIKDEFQEEISIVEAALSRLQDEDPSQLS